MQSLVPACRVLFPRAEFTSRVQNSCPHAEFRVRVQNLRTTRAACRLSGHIGEGQQPWDELMIGRRAEFHTFDTSLPPRRKTRRAEFWTLLNLLKFAEKGEACRIPYL